MVPQWEDQASLAHLRGLQVEQWYMWSKTPIVGTFVMPTSNCKEYSVAVYSNRHLESWDIWNVKHIETPTSSISKKSLMWLWMTTIENPFHFQGEHPSIASIWWRTLLYIPAISMWTAVVFFRGGCVRTFPSDDTTKPGVVGFSCFPTRSSQRHGALGSLPRVLQIVGKVGAHTLW